MRRIERRTGRCAIILRALVAICVPVAAMIGSSSMPAAGAVPSLQAVGMPMAVTTQTVPQLVFTSDPDGDARVLPSDVNNPSQNSDIYRINADGSGRMALTDAPHNDGSPAAAPDGSRIAFTSSRDGNEEIYVMGRNGSGQTDISNNPGGPDQNSSWSPDGSEIVFASIRGGNLDLYVMQADGSDQQRLTQDPAGEDWPAWSPDGARIAFIANLEQPGRWDLYTIRSDGSALTRVTKGMQVFGRVAWSPNGRTLVFSSAADGNPDLFTVNAGGSHLRRLTDDRALRADRRNAVPNPHGAKGVELVVPRPRV